MFIFCSTNKKGLCNKARLYVSYKILINIWINAVNFHTGVKNNNSISFCSMSLFSLSTVCLCCAIYVILASSISIRLLEIFEHQSSNNKSLSVSLPTWANLILRSECWAMFACHFPLTRHRVSMLAITNCYEAIQMCLYVCVLLEVECWDSRLASAGPNCCVCLVKWAINPPPWGVTWAKSNIGSGIKTQLHLVRTYKSARSSPFRDNKGLNANSFRHLWASLLP